MLLVPHLRAGHKHRASEAASPPPRYSPLPTPRPVPELQSAGGGWDTWGWGHPGRSKTCSDVPAGAAGEWLGLKAWVTGWSSGAGKSKHRRAKGPFHLVLVSPNAWPASFWGRGGKENQTKKQPPAAVTGKGKMQMLPAVPCPMGASCPCLGWDFIISIEKKKRILVSCRHCHMHITNTETQGDIYPFERGQRRGYAASEPQGRRGLPLATGLRFALKE